MEAAHHFHLQLDFFQGLFSTLTSRKKFNTLPGRISPFLLVIGTTFDLSKIVHLFILLIEPYQCQWGPLFSVIISFEEEIHPFPLFLFLDPRTRPGENSKWSCGSSYFRCKNGRCVLRSKQCDGINDCGDHSDELNCTNIENDKFKCKVGPYVPKNLLCNHEPDCLDASDEMNCRKSSTNTISLISTKSLSYS